ncbi:hypothetical protein GM3708_2368 [Geminocystis sp. NIES-3708]|nr:hypothetical protein GM3708_2368 [Geminocystis sp. NIES-3708]
MLRQENSFELDILNFINQQDNNNFVLFTYYNIPPMGIIIT